MTAHTDHPLRHYDRTCPGCKDEQQRIATHWEGCGAEGGPRHYECLLREYERLERELAEVKAAQSATERSAIIEECAQVMQRKHEELAKRSYPPPTILLEMRDAIRALDRTSPSATADNGRKA